MFTDTLEATSNFTGNFTRTILVVEDEEPIRAVICEFLADCGHTVIEAATVKQAKELLLDRKVDLVFSDVNMPGGETGFGLEQWVRRHYSNTQVLLTSGYPQSKTDIDGLLEPLVAKPYSLRVVLQRIERMLRAGSWRDA